MTPTFSILTPTRNRRAWIGRCIRSVQNQTFDDWEMVIYDVGDESETVEDLIPDDPRIRYHRGECRGPAADFQSALSLAVGCWVTPLSDDDRLPRHALRSALAAGGDADWLNGRTVLVNEDGWPIGFRGGTWQHIAESKTGMFMLGGGVYWRRSLTDELGGFKSEFDGAADMDLYRRFLRHSEPARTGETLYLHTVWPGQDTQANQARQNDATRRILEAA